MHGVGAYREVAGTLIHVWILTIAVAVALAFALWRLVQRERERRALRRLLDTTEPDLAAAIRTSLRGRVEREELSEALALRDALLDAAPYPVMLFDGGGRLARANAEARTLIAGLVSGSQAQHDGLAVAVRDALAGRSPRPTEVTVYEPKRRRYHAHVRSFRARDGRGCAVVLAEESAEADFRDARSLFSAGVSHELRTPLARMLAVVDTLSLPLDEGERERTVQQMRDEIDGMRVLIEEMVLLVRLESGEQAGSGTAADVTEAVTACIKRHDDLAAREHVTLHEDATRGLVAAIAPTLLDALLDNLAGNALRHAGGGAAVRIGARGLAGAVEIEVSDNGRGIPAAHLPHVFERFYRVEGARSGPGTGLGLAIVKHIAESHGGRAEIESRPGEGTTVRVVLAAPAAARRRLSVGSDGDVA